MFNIVLIWLVFQSTTFLYRIEKNMNKLNVIKGMLMIIVKYLIVVGLRFLHE